MIFLISTKIATIGTDHYLASNLIANNVKFAELCNVFESYNEKYNLDLLPQDALSDLINKIKKVVSNYIDYDNGIRFNNFNLLLNGVSIIEVDKSKMYDIKCENSITIDEQDKDYLKSVISHFINESSKKNNIPADKIHELIFNIELLILEKGHPIAIIEPGELSKNNHETVWRCRTKGYYNDEDGGQYDGWEDF